MCLFAVHTDENTGQLGRGRRKKTVSMKVADQSDGTEGSIFDSTDGSKHVYKVSQDGRYICHICEKTFKTVSHTFCLHVFIFESRYGNSIL